MQNLIKTTITLPQDLFQLVKMKAVQDKTNVSALVRLGLIQQIHSQKSEKSKKSITSFFGSLPDKKYVPPRGSSILDEMFREKYKPK